MELQIQNQITLNEIKHYLIFPFERKNAPHSKQISNLQHLKNCYKGLFSLRNENGLFRAAPGPEYREHAWIRDSQYCSLPFLYHKSVNHDNIDLFLQTQHVILDRLIGEESKMDNFINKNGNVSKCERIHPKFSAKDCSDVLFGDNAWGYIQNDAIGQTLFNISLAAKADKNNILRNEKDYEIVEKLIKYCCITYYKDWDNGIWEEQAKINSSSIASCLMGLLSIESVIPKLNKFAQDRKINASIKLPDNFNEKINKGKKVLYDIFTQQNKNELTPQESPYCSEISHLHRSDDLTLLSLIFPFGLADIEFAEKIIDSTERNLVRERGVIRYRGDSYYNRQSHYQFHNSKHNFGKFPDGINSDVSYYHTKFNTEFSQNTPFLGNEAEWCMGFPWLAINCKIISDEYNRIGNHNKAKIYYNKCQNYMTKCKDIINENGMPELYFSGTDKPNVNDPLAWANSMYILAYKYTNELIPDVLKTKLIPDLKAFLQ